MTSRILHNALVTILAVAACLTIVGASLSVWVHATVLNTDRFVATVDAATSDPVILQQTSDRLALRIVDGLGVPALVASILPDRLDRLSQPIVEAITGRLSDALYTVLTNERFRSAWTGALTTLHERAVALLRGDAANAQLSGGVLTIDLAQVVGDALRQLQADGVIDASIPIPDMSAPSERLQRLTELGASLGVTVPEDLGTVQVSNADGLQRLSTVVQIADVGVYVLAALGGVLALLTIWIADRRRRAVLVLTLGVELLLLLIAAGTAALSNSAASSIAANDGPALIVGFANALSASLEGWLIATGVGAALLGALAYFFVRSRPAAAEVEQV